MYIVEYLYRGAVCRSSLVFGLEMIPILHRLMSDFLTPSMQNATFHVTHWSSLRVYISFKMPPATASPLYEPPFSPSCPLPEPRSCSNLLSLKNSLRCLNLSNSECISSFSNGILFVCSGLGQKSGTEKRLSRFVP